MAGKEAPFCLVTLWCYAGENHRADGVLGGYTPEEIESFAGWTGKRGRFFQALLDSEYLDKETLKLHDWEDHEGHLVVYHQRALQANRERWLRAKHEGLPQGVREGIHQGVLEGDLQGIHEGVLQGVHQASVKDSQSRAVQSSSENLSPERRSEKMSESLDGSDSAASPSTPTASALRAGEENGRGDRAPTEPKTKGQIEYEQKLTALSKYLMDHCKIGGNGNRTPAVIAEFREQAGRFEKLLRERKNLLTEGELVAAAKVAFVKAESLDRIAAFTTVLYRKEEASQVYDIVKTARNMVARGGA
jgi:hypothetical protein